MHGTFYVSAALPGTSGYYMTWSQIADLAADGNEIGGHGLNDISLTTGSLTDADIRHEVCDERGTLADHGISTASFAYPAGQYNDNVRAIVAGCGYPSARRTGGLQDAVECNGCPTSNSIPPADPTRVRSQEWVAHPYSLNDLKTLVSQANGTGWVPITFADLCDACGSASVSPADFSAFLDWLATQPNVTVKTVREVVAPTDALAPTTTITCNDGTCANPLDGPISVKLSASDGGSGVKETRYTTDGSAPTITSPLYSGPVSVSATTTFRFRSWDNAGNPEPARTQQVSIAPPRSNVTVSLSFDDGAANQYPVRSLLASHGMKGTFFIGTTTPGTAGYYMSWSQIADLASDGNEIAAKGQDISDLTVLTDADARRQACNSHANLADHGINASSFAYPFGRSTATLRTIVASCGYAVGRAYGGLRDPLDCAGCPTANALPPADAMLVRTQEWQATPYSLSDLQRLVTQAENNGGGWVPIAFGDLCDCGGASASATTLSAFMDWLAARSNVTVKTVRQAVPPADGTPPQTTISCTGGSCAGQLAPTTKVTLNATDGGGSGVAAIRYTTDGSTPTIDSPVYSGPITADHDFTLKVRGWDNAGNPEAAKAQVLNVQEAPAPATVSLTFDDGAATQFQAGQLLADRGMRGTFYINSAKIGDSSYYMTWSQLQTLANQGQEIGGHTLDHPNLTTLTATDVQHEICDDRQALIDHGFSVSSFAYPFGATNAAVQATVLSCGYTTARLFGGIYDPSDCTNCPFSETIPAGIPTRVRSSPYVAAPLTAAIVEDWITTAQSHGGGWVPIVFHDLCSNCGNSAMSVQEFTTFLDWLKNRQNVTVKTMRGVMPPVDAAPPTTTLKCGGVACGSGWYLPNTQLKFTATDAKSTVTATRYTTDGSVPTASSPLVPNVLALAKTTTIKYRSWDSAGNVEDVQTLQFKIDATAPKSTIACNGGTCPLTGYLPTPTSVTLSATDGESGVSAIRYTTDGTSPTSSSPQYTGPISLTSSKTVRFRAYDNAGNAELVQSKDVRIDPTAPKTTISCNFGPCSGNWYTNSVSVRLSATDTGGSGLDEIHYTLDGTVPDTTDLLYGGSFQVAKLTTVTYRAYDNAGNAEVPGSTVLKVDTVDPVTQLLCNGSPCTTQTYKGPVTLSAKVTDADSGAAETHYTLDGTTPTKSSPLYTGPGPLYVTTTFRFRSWDVAGNVETTRTFKVTVN